MPEKREIHAASNVFRSLAALFKGLSAREKEKAFGVFFNYFCDEFSLAYEDSKELYLLEERKKVPYLSKKVDNDLRTLAKNDSLEPKLSVQNVREKPSDIARSFGHVLGWLFAIITFGIGSPKFTLDKISRTEEMVLGNITTIADNLRAVPRINLKPIGELVGELSAEISARSIIPDYQKLAFIREIAKKFS